jgi:hypothetical protein
MNVLLLLSCTCPLNDNNLDGISLSCINTGSSHSDGQGEEETDDDDDVDDVDDDDEEGNKDDDEAGPNDSVKEKI